MSADNGFIIRKNVNNKFVLQEYCASAEDYPAIDSPRGESFDTLEAAALRYAEISNDEHMVIEYGLSISVDKVTT